MLPGPVEHSLFFPNYFVQYVMYILFTLNFRNESHLMQISRMYISRDTVRTETFAYSPSNLHPRI